MTQVEHDPTIPFLIPSSEGQMPTGNSSLFQSASLAGTASYTRPHVTFSGEPTTSEAIHRQTVKHGACHPVDRLVMIVNVRYSRPN